MYFVSNDLYCGILLTLTLLFINNAVLLIALISSINILSKLAVLKHLYLNHCLVKSSVRGLYNPNEKTIIKLQNRVQDIAKVLFFYSPISFCLFVNPQGTSFLINLTIQIGKKRCNGDLFLLIN